MLLVLSSLFGATGGIPSFNQLLVRAASDFAASQGLPLAIVALTDPPGTASPPGASYVPCGGDRARCVAEVLRLLPQHRFVLLGHVNLAPLGLAARLLRRPFGVIAHGADVWTPLSWHRRRALRLAQVVACVSDDTAAHVIRQQGVAPDRCLRIINAIATVPPIPPAPVESAALRIVSVTRLHPGEPKGIDLLLHALAGLPSGSTTYTVIGDGAERASLRSLAETLGLGARVRFAGLVSDAERDAALDACDLFALPSSNEGFGIVYLEAMARAKPCLAARVGGAPEVVLDEQTGLCVAPTVPAVREALVRLGDPALRAKLGAAGRDRLLSHFTYNAFRRHAFKLFSRLSDPSRRSDG